MTSVANVYNPSNKVIMLPKTFVINATTTTSNAGIIKYTIVIMTLLKPVPKLCHQLKSGNFSSRSIPDLMH